MTIIVSYLEQTQGTLFEEGLQFILKIIGKGYTNLLTSYPRLFRKIMGHFVALSSSLKNLESIETRYRQFFTLSILAEIVRQEPQVELGFTIEFLRELFEIELESMTYDAKNRLLAIIGVLYSSMSRQPKLMKELKMGERLKEKLL